ESRRRGGAVRQGRRGARFERAPRDLAGRDGPYPRSGSDEEPSQEARIVVIGDREFVSNRLPQAPYNRHLFLNAVRWLGNDEQRIALSDKGWTPNQDPLTLQQTVAYFYFLAFALPEALLLLGIFSWWRQRA